MLQRSIARRGAILTPGSPAAPPGSTFIRLILRFGLPATSGVEWDHLTFEQVMETLPALGFVIVQRNALTLQQAETLSGACKTGNVDLIFEIDDDLVVDVGDRIPADAVAAMRHLLGAAKVVLTSTHLLRGKLLAFNPNVVVIDNKLSSRIWLGPMPLSPPVAELPPQDINVLYMGTYSHGRDLDLVRPALERLRKDNIPVTLHMVGIDKDAYGDFIRRIDVPSGWSSYPKFVFWLRAMASQFSFAVAPLVDDAFNRCKSGLKYMDYAALGLPGIFTDIHPYRELVDDGRTGILTPNHPDAWTAAFRIMCDGSGRREAMAAAALADVKTNHTTESNIHLFSQAIGARTPTFEGYGLQSERQTASRTIGNSPMFDPYWYADRYLRFRNLGPEAAALHYMQEGWKMGNDPSPLFSTADYLDRYRDVKRAGINPLGHFLKHGFAEGRAPRPVEYRPTPLTRVGQLAAPEVSLGRPSICIHLHLYHRDLLREMTRYLANVTLPFTLLVSVQAKDEDGVQSRLEDGLPQAKVIVRPVPNRGRDTAPWVVNFRDEICAHDFFCHLHTKRTVHTQGHQGWREHLAQEILGSRRHVAQVLSILSEPDVGLVIPIYYQAVSPQPQWGANRERCRQLWDRTAGGELMQACPDYPTGSFFWAKVEILRPLFDLNLSLEDFEAEAGQDDGTLAHAVERFVGVLPHVVGLRTLSTGALEPEFA